MIALETYSSEIRGRVLRQGSQELVSGVIVKVLGTDQKFITDDQGEFEITELPTGTYQLTLTRFRMTNPDWAALYIFATSIRAKKSNIIWFFQRR